jgi:molybdopterin molybdotransferase
MPQFLNLIPLSDAMRIYKENLAPFATGTEAIPTVEALNRVLAKHVISQEALPPFTRAAVDGYAVIAADTFGASESLPAYLRIVGEVPMGNEPAFGIVRGETAVIHTGGMLPEGTEAVVMVEDTQLSDQEEVEIMRAVAAGDNTIKAGEDVSPGEEVLPAGIYLRTADIAGLIALGYVEVEVSIQPRIGIISSGDEIIPPDQQPHMGQVRDINSYSLSALVQKHGGVPLRYGIVSDAPDVLAKTLRQAYDECDAVIITAGSSASTRDVTAEVVGKLGQPGVLVHGVRIRPGKPTILAVCDGKPIIGLPGNPVSALVISNLFVAPTIEYLLGVKVVRPVPTVKAVLSTNVSSQTGREDYVPVRLRRTEEGYMADPIFFKSNMIFSLAQADGLMYIPADAAGLPPGEMLEIVML